MEKTLEAKKDSSDKKVWKPPHGFKINKNNIKLFRHMSDMTMNAVAREFRKATYQNKELKKYCYNTKQEVEGKNGKEYGYYINTVAPADIIIALYRYRLNGVVDIGAGVGHVLWYLQRFGIWPVVGYEIDKILVDECKKVHPDVPIKKLDFFNSRKEHYKKYDLIYFWEPIFCAKLSEKFVAKLMRIIEPGKYIAHRSDGVIRYHLQKQVEKGKLKELPTIRALDMYKVIA